MQREYRFRGKIINHSRSGEWVHGSLIQEPSRCRIFVAHSDVRSEMYEVDPETICMWTGKVAYDGVPVYHGDIVRDYHMRDFIHEVRWISGPDDGAYFVGLDWCGEHPTTVGNRWDNPELLDTNEKE